MDALLRAVLMVTLEDVLKLFGGSVKAFWDWLWENFLKPFIVDPILMAIESVFDAIGDAVSQVVGGLLSILKAPLDALLWVYANLNGILAKVLGPFAFLLPLVWALIAVVSLLAAYYVLKFVLPVI